MKTKQRLGWGTGVGGVLALALGGLAACGSDFASDCRETRTCPATDDNLGGENAGGAPDGVAGSQSQTGGGGADAAAGADGSAETAGGAGSSDAGAAAGGAPDCHLAGNCPNEPPTVVAVTPADEALGVEPDATIVIELSEPLDEATVTAGNIQILDGGVPVKGQLTYADSKVTFTPEKPLALLAAYEVQLSTAVTDVEGAGLAEAFGSSFAVRDGAWSVTTVVAGAISVAPKDLQLTSDGRALLAWSGAETDHCPTSARWYERGAPIGNLKTLSYAQNQYCLDVHSGVSPSGLAIVSWFEEDNQGQSVATAEFRNGKWGAATLRSTRFDNQRGAAAISDDGTAHFIGAGSDVLVWQTSTAGVWSANGKPLSTFYPKTGVKAAAATNGDAAAAWVDVDASARDRVLVTKFSRQTATWSTPAVLPGSLSGASDANRGAPALAFDAANQPLVVWKRGAELVASRFDSVQGAWAGYVKVASLGDQASIEAPAVAFDGKTFVVAYTSLKGKAATVNVVSYDPVAEAWGTPTPMHAADTKVTSRMPRLTADAHGNLLVVWPSLVSTGVYTLAYQRFDATSGVWLGVQPIAGVAIHSTEFITPGGYGDWALGGAANGLAVATFADQPAWPSKLQLASFY